VASDEDGVRPREPARWLQPGSPARVFCALGWKPVGMLVVYVILAGVYTSPLLQQSGSRIASDPYDPILNASILWWNATTLPFSTAWWNPPYFYPSEGVSTFTENLVGVSALSTPVYWITGNPLTTYNLALFLTWPLSAFGTYLLVRFLTRREDAAIVAGLAYAFTPYRTAELGHLQMLSSYWLPIILLGLHGFLEHRRPGWLLLFGGAWLLQSLANGYFIFFGGVLIGLWILYFCSTRDRWRAAPALIGTWCLASLPLVPILLKYETIHEHFALRRSLEDPLGFSAPIRSWIEVSPLVSFWGRWLPSGSDDLFPGLTVVVLVLGALIASMRGHTTRAELRSQRARVGRVALVFLSIASLSAILLTLTVGPWRVSVGPVVLRITNIDRALTIFALCCMGWLLVTDRVAAALRRRSPFLFYSCAALAMGIFACGPVLRVGSAIVYQPAPYRWLMHLPGFGELRVPMRFWMLGVLCLAVAAALAVPKLIPRGHRWRKPVFALTAAGILFDGWIGAMPMARPPEHWLKVERRDQSQPILELPLGPEWDAAGTFRSIRHRRRVVNGVSGYDPPHYAPLQEGLNAHDPGMLLALTSLGPLDVVVNGAADPDHAWAKYVSTFPGALLVAADGMRSAYRIPESTGVDPVLGEPLPVARALAFRHDAGTIVDGRVETEWGDDPQRPGQWVAVDLGAVRQVGGVTHALGEYARDFPRLLAIDVSIDGDHWDQVWKGPAAGLAFLAAARRPREAAMHFALPPRSARFVRLRQLARHKNLWRVAEVKVHAPLK
jgi:hypothetical protein